MAAKKVTLKSLHDRLSRVESAVIDGPLYQRHVEAHRQYLAERDPSGMKILAVDDRDCTGWLVNVVLALWAIIAFSGIWQICKWMWALGST